MPAKAAISQTTSRHRGGAFFSAPTAALGVRALFRLYSIVWTTLTPPRDFARWQAASMARYWLNPFCANMCRSR